MITKIDGIEVIHLQGFDTGKEVIISDSDRMSDYKKVDIVLPKDMLEFLITDRGLLDNLNIDITVIGQKFDEDFEEEEIVVCSHCGCEENAEEMRDGMCPDCYEDWMDDLDEEDDEE